MAVLCSSPSTRDRGGFTLLECIAATVILGGTLVAALSLLAIHDQSYASEEVAWKALALLERESEKIHFRHFDTLQTTLFAPLFDAPEYSMRHLVEDLDGNTRRVTVEIEWTNPLGNSRTENATTLRFRGVDR